MIYLESSSFNPYFNLALEQFVFDELGKKENCFMLWQNDNSIIIGKNQNTVEEINASFVKENKINVARRLSGGGAVYHDLGNLNFTFVSNAANADKLDLQFFCKPIAAALSTLGVQAEISGRNDITIEGKKFSGNAQYIKDGRIMHHGTIMFSSNLDTVMQALNVSGDKIVSKGFKSIRSRVTNVSEHIKNPITLLEFKNILLDFILKEEKFDVYKLKDADIDGINKLKDEKYATWDWNYGKSPEYSIKKKRKVENSGIIEICMQTAEGGIITDMKIYGDFFGIKDVDSLGALFIGKKANEENYKSVLSQVKTGDYINNLSNEQF
jgi:lipoate-protein ligase A